MAIIVNSALFIMFGLQLWTLWRQVRDAEQATKLDHQRRKAQATVEFYEATLAKRTQLGHILPQDRDKENIAHITRRAMYGNEEAEKSITEYMNLMELLATGVLREIFDLATINRIAGGRICALEENYKVWVDIERKRDKSPELYIEIEELARQLRRIREDEKWARRLEDIVEAASLARQLGESLLAAKLERQACDIRSAEKGARRSKHKGALARQLKDICERLESDST